MAHYEGFNQKSSRKSFYHWNGIYCIRDLFAAPGCKPLEVFSLVSSMLQAHNTVTTHRGENDHASLSLMIISFSRIISGSQFCKSEKLEASLGFCQIRVKKGYFSIRHNENLFFCGGGYSYFSLSVAI